MRDFRNSMHHTESSGRKPVLAILILGIVVAAGGCAHAPVEQHNKLSYFHSLQAQAENSVDIREKSNFYTEAGLWLVVYKQNPYKAEALFEKALEVDPSNINAAYARAVVASRNGDFDKVVELLKPLEEVRDTNISFFLTEATLKSGNSANYAEGARILNSMRLLGCSHPLMPEVYATLVACQLKLHRFDDAQRSLEEAQACGLDDRIAPEIKALVALGVYDMPAFETVKDSAGVKEMLLQQPSGQ